MAAIQGVNSKFPCPICLVPHTKLLNLSQQYPLRTTKSMQEVFNTAATLNRTESEALLKDVGLCSVKVCDLTASIVVNTDFLLQNVFWDIQNSDPYHALSWDRLHAYHGGLFSDHLLPEVFKLVSANGRDSESLLDKQCVTIITLYL